MLYLETKDAAGELHSEVLFPEDTPGNRKILELRAEQLRPQGHTRAVICWREESAGENLAMPLDQLLDKLAESEIGINISTMDGDFEFALIDGEVFRVGSCKELPAMIHKVVLSKYPGSEYALGPKQHSYRVSLDKNNEYSKLTSPSSEFVVEEERKAIQDAAKVAYDAKVAAASAKAEEVLAAVRLAAGEA